MLMHEGIIFDLDGVITDTARYHFLAWKHMANLEGMDIDEEFNESLKGVGRMESLDLILAKNKRDYPREKKEALAKFKNEYYLQLIQGMTAEDLLPGADATLKAVREMGMKTALASASKNAGTILEKLRIVELFDVVVDAAGIKNSKPDPEIFLAAAKQLNLKPSQCLGVEDAVAGVQAIKAAGMYAIGVGDPKVLTMADRVIPNLTSFPIGSLSRLQPIQ
jgi:beta-phosphoglucomutase